MNYQPVFLIGAARSGTKLLRDVIASHPAIDRVPYDINFIWRLGNESVAHDELIPEKHTTPRIVKQIRQKLEAYNTGAPFLIEKTVSNSLRVPFVEAIFPTAKYIFLFRDGLDAVESSHRQWMSPPDWNYLMEKASSFPFMEAPSYALKYLTNLAKKCGIGGHKTAATWGPRYDGIDQDVAGGDLLRVCALQWARSIEKAFASLQALERSKAISVRYEDFVKFPGSCLAEIADFLGVDPGPYRERSILAGISTDSIGRGRRQLAPAQQNQVIDLVQYPMELLGYGCPGSLFGDMKLEAAQLMNN